MGTRKEKIRIRKKKAPYTAKNPWYWEHIKEKQVYQLFDEIRELNKLLMEVSPGIFHFPKKPTIQGSKKFSPQGAIVHVSNTKTLRQTISCNNRDVYSSHFIILSNRYIPKIKVEKFKLARSLPSTVIMPFGIDEYIPHSGYLSPVTWGIELRNRGFLRPSEENFVGDIDPLRDHNDFRMWQRDPLYYFWRENSWTSNYEQPAYTWQGFHYERFTLKQYMTLCIIIKCLARIKKLNPALILPSSALMDEPNNSPIIPYDLFQRKVRRRNNKKEPQFKLAEFYTLQKNGGMFHKDRVTDELDSYINDDLVNTNVQRSAWRGTQDKEKLLNVFKHGDVKYPRIFSKYKKVLEFMGYHTDVYYFTKSVHLYANARNIELNEDALEASLERDFYNLVNGSYER